MPSFGFLKVSGFKFSGEELEQNEVEHEGKPVSWKRVRYILQRMGITQVQMRKLTMRDVQDLVGEYYAQRADDYHDLMRIIVPAMGGSVDDDLPPEAGAPKSFYASKEDEEEGIISEEALGFLGGMLSVSP